MPERLLLTGARGCIGRATIAPLRALGFEVHAVTRGAPGGGGATWHQADLLDPDAAAWLIPTIRPAVLMHAAWYVEHGKFWHAPENAAWVRASLPLAHAFAAAGGRRFIGIGSCAEYADAAGADDAPWPEHRPLRPATAYGAAKVELAARLAAELPQLSLGWARLFHLFGPGEPAAKLVPDVALALLAGREARCGSGQAIRDFASTAYLGRALAALARSEVTGAVNIASGEARPMRSLIALIGDLVGRPDLIRLGARADPANEAPCMVADVTRMRRELGFKEVAELREDLAAYVAALRGAGSDGGRDRD